jgi:hypothetical protein
MARRPQVSAENPKVIRLLESETAPATGPEDAAAKPPPPPKSPDPADEAALEALADEAQRASDA